jgi:carboxypeptidase family protein
MKSECVRVVCVGSRAEPRAKSVQGDGNRRGTAWWSLRLLTAVVLVAACAAVGTAQVPTGSITGTVQDAQGLAIADATVTLTSLQTNRSFTSKTGSVGGYQFERIDYGLYRVSVTKDGFKSGVVNAIKLDASTEYSVVPITLEVGSPTQTVVVEAGAELVQTTSAEVTGTVEKKQIEDLPILDRNPLALVALQAGVNAQTPGGAEETTINGQRVSFTNVTLDGINIQDNFIRQNAVDFLPNLPFNSQADEFTIINQNADVEKGGGASQVSLVTPKGTNDWHGEGFWYYRTNAWAANDWFNSASGVPKTNLLQNQGGGNAGGPILKNKLFIYGYYELLRLRETSPNNTTILSPALRSALTGGTLPFTYIPQGGTTPVTVPDLLSLKNSVDGSPVLTLDPAMIALLKGMPTASNNTRVGDGFNLLGYQFNARNNATQDNYGFRVDYDVNAHNSFSGTWSWNRQITDRPDIDTSFDTVPLVNNNNSIKFLSTAWRWSPNANWTNELRFGFDLAPGYFFTQQNFGSYLLDNTSLPFTDPNPNFYPQGRDTHTWSWQDNADWVRGNHTIKFGVQIQRVTIFQRDAAGTLPTYSLGFGSVNTNGLLPTDFPQPIGQTDFNNANSLLPSLAGILTQVAQTFNVTTRTSGFVTGAPQHNNFRQNDWSFYLGDTWKIKRNLTLTYGTRYEYFSPVDERDGLILLPVVPGGQTATQTLLSNATVDFAGGPSGRPLYHRDMNNFGPNIGVAWDPRGDGKLAVRAGFSVNYVNDAFFTAAANAGTGNSGLSSTPVNNNNGNGLAGPTVSNPVGVSAPQFQIPIDFATNATNVGVGSNAGYAIDPNIRTPYVEQWNLSIQKNLGWNTTLSVGYVGNHGVGLFRAVDVNQVELVPNGFLDDFNRARSNGFLALAANPAGGFVPDYDPSIAGSQQLPVFANICGTGANGFIDFPFIATDIQQGQAGDLADIYHVSGCDPPGSTNFFAPNGFINGGDLLKNASFSTYHAGVIEVRRRFNQGLYFQANYVYSKTMTDYSADTNGNQSRFQPYLTNADPRLEKGRAGFDLTHAFKANFTYELPLGKGHRLSPSNGILSRLASGWNTASVFTWQSGPAFSIVSQYGTVNRLGFRSLRNTAFSTLTHQQISNDLGTFIQPNGTVYLINPALINADGSGAAPPGLTCAPLVSGGFCNPQPGQTGNLQINGFSGPAYFDWDLAAGKDTPITERIKLTFRAESFNVLNHPVFSPQVFEPLQGNNYNEMLINTSTFGQAATTTSRPRILQLSLKLTF